MVGLWPALLRIERKRGAQTSGVEIRRMENGDAVLFFSSLVMLESKQNLEGSAPFTVDHTLTNFGDV